MKFDYLILDCYNIFYRASSGKPERIIEYGGEKFHTEGIIAFFNLVQSYIDKYLADGGKIYWLMDNAKTQVKKLRKLLSEDYKKTRVEQPIWFYRQLDLIELIIKYLRDDSYLFRIKNIEADDFCTAVIDNLLDKSKKALMISEDMDWCRSLSDNIYQYRDGKLFTKEDFKNKYGFEATYSNICFYKSFYGDSVDNILPALGTLPPIFFNQIIKEYEVMNSFLSMVENNKVPYLDSGWRLNILKNQDKIRLNWELVTSIDLSFRDLTTYQYTCKFQENKLKIIYDDLDLYSMDKRFSKKMEKSDFLNALLAGEDMERRL